MATVASLQIKIGADVSAAINGLSKAEFAATKVKEAYIEANDATVKGGFAIAGWAQNFSTAIGAVKRNLDSIDLTKLSKEQQDSTSSMLSLASGALRVTENVTVASAAFSGMQSIAGPALAGIARLIPSIGASLAGLAGPIGLAVGALAAGAALIVSNWDLIAGSVSDVEKITIAANKATTEQKAKTIELIDVLKNDVSTRKEQAEALKKLNEISPTYFGGLQKEKTTVDQLNVAYKSYATNLDNIAKLQAINTEVSALYQKQVQTQIALQDATASATQEQLKYNTAAASAREGTKNELPLVLAKNTVAAKKEELEAINAQIAKYKELGKAIPPVTREPNVPTGAKGKDTETEADKIQGVLDSLGKKLQLIQSEFKAGIIPDDFAAQVDAVQSAISQIGSINPNSEAFKQLIEDYKALANQNPVSIDFIPRVAVPDVSSLNVLPNRAAEVAAQMNASFSNVKFLQSFEPKVIQVKNAVSKQIDEIGKIVSTASSVFGNAISVIGEFDQASFANREATVDAYYAKQKDYIEKSISDEGLKGKKMEALEKEVAAKRRAIKRDEAAANKRSAIFSAIINTARAIAESLPNIALSVAAGALGAAQVAAIASTPLPALQAGGLVRGRNTVVVGEYAGADNNPELISPVNKVKKYITEAVIESGGGGITQLVSYISGDDLVLISERGQYRKNRLG